MLKKEILECLKSKEGKNLQIKMSDKKIMIRNNICELKNDELFINSATSKEFVVINLNEVRSIKNTEKNIIIYLDDKDDTIIKITID